MCLGAKELVVIPESSLSELNAANLRRRPPLLHTKISSVEDSTVIADEDQMKINGRAASFIRMPSDTLESRDVLDRPTQADRAAIP